MVPTGKHVQEVYVGEGKSVLSALKEMSQDERADTLCMDQSTIEQSVSKAVALQLRQVGADLVDAPVSGGNYTEPLISAIVAETPRCRCNWRRKGYIGHHGRRIQDIVQSLGPRA